MTAFDPREAERQLQRQFEEERRRREAEKYDWESKHARQSQIRPKGKWQRWVIMGGRGSGKTRTLNETARLWVREGYDHVNLVAATDSDARQILIEGPSGILKICPDDELPKYYPARQLLAWPNGARSLVLSAEDPERLRGHQHSKLLCDEVAAWSYPEAAWDMLMFGLRLGDNPQAVVATTPKPSKFLRDLLVQPGTVHAGDTTYANAANLAPQFLDRIVGKYHGTRLGQQELLGILLDELEGALFKQSLIDATRIALGDL